MHPQWERLGLTPEEWRDCQLAAVEMSIAAGAQVQPQDIALEYVRARVHEAIALAALRPER